MARGQRADVVLMDIGMPLVDGILAMKLIAAESDASQIKVIILTALEAGELVVAALRSGASGYVRQIAGFGPSPLLRSSRRGNGRS